MHGCKKPTIWVNFTQASLTDSDIRKGHKLTTIPYRARGFKNAIR